MTSFTHNIWVFASSFFEISSDSSYVNARVPTNRQLLNIFCFVCIIYNMSGDIVLDIQAQARVNQK